MKCANNPIKKRFLFWEFDDFGNHKLIVILIQYDHFFKKWKIHYKCEFCESEDETNWLNDIELIQILHLKRVPRKGEFSNFSTFYHVKELKEYK